MKTKFLIITFFYLGLILSCSIKKGNKIKDDLILKSRILKIICSKSPNDVCIEVDSLGNVKYANANWGNNLNPKNGIVDSYYEGLLGKENLKSIFNSYQELKSKCLSKIDSNITYLDVSEAYCIVYYAGNKKETFESILANKDCWSFIENLFKSVQKRNLKLNHNTYHFESTKFLLPSNIIK